MDKLNALIAQLKETDEKIDNLLAHDELTDEQRAEHDGLVAERKKSVAAITKEKDRLAREEERRKLDAEAEEAKTRQAEQDATKKAAAEKAKRQELAGTGRLTDPDQPRTQDVPAERTEAREGRTVIPATVKRYGALKYFAGVKLGRSAEERAYRFGMWAQAQLAMQMPNRYRFPVAQDFYQRNYAIVHQSNNATGAQYLIPEEFSADMIDLRETYGIARRLFRVERMTSDTKVIPRRQSGLTAYFVAESAVKPESNMSWDEVRLTAQVLAVISRWTNQVDADAVINFGDMLASEIATAFAQKEDEASFNGDGTSTYGGIVGVRTKLQDVDGAGTDSAGLVTAAGNLWSEILLTDLEAVVGRLPRYADTPRAAWVTHKAFFYGVMKRLELAAGGVTSQEIGMGGGAGQRSRPLFLGYPVEFSEVFPTTEANSQVVAALGDFSLGAMFGDRQQDSIMFSEHATVGGESVFERNQIAIRGEERFDVVVHSVGDASAAGPIVGLQTAAS
jgi:HK97 family phage major capsid protein